MIRRRIVVSRYWLKSTPVTAWHDAEDLLEAAPRRSAGERLRRRRRGEVGVVADLGQPPGDLLGRQDEIDAAAVDGAARHAGVPGRLLVLGEGDAAHGLDLAQPQRAVGAGAGEDHADGAGLLVLGQRAEQVIDRQVRAAPSLARRDMQDALRAIGEVRRWAG